MIENSRRLFLKTLALGAASLVVAPVLRIQSAIAGALVSAGDPLVKALKYVPKAPDSKKNCASCQFYSSADPKAKQGMCQLIPSGEVLAAGYCKSYSPKAKS